jgi:hypothetical protein
MTRLRICAFALFFAAPVSAQTDAPPDEAAPNPFQQGLERFLDDLTDQMAPHLRELDQLMEEFGPAVQSFLMQMGPALSELMDRIDDWSAYEMPEVLPNGDIIIRRKPDAPALPPETEAPGIDI